MDGCCRLKSAWLVREWVPAVEAALGLRLAALMLSSYGASSHFLNAMRVKILLETWWLNNCHVALQLRRAWTLMVVQWLDRCHGALELRRAWTLMVALRLHTCHVTLELWRAWTLLVVQWLDRCHVALELWRAWSLMVALRLHTCHVALELRKAWTLVVVLRLHSSCHTVTNALDRSRVGLVALRLESCHAALHALELVRVKSLLVTGSLAACTSGLKFRVSAWRVALRLSIQTCTLELWRQDPLLVVARRLDICYKGRSGLERMP